MNMSDYLNETTPERKEVRVCFDRTLLSQVEDAEDQLAAADPSDMLGDTERAELKAALEDLKDQARDKSRSLVFEGIGRRPWRELISEHPPRDEDRDQMLEFNPETFYAAAMAATCVAPGMTAEEAQELIDTMPIMVVNVVMDAVFKANIIGSRDPFAAASAGAPSGGKKSRPLPR